MSACATHPFWLSFEGSQPSTSIPNFETHPPVFVMFLSSRGLPDHGLAPLAISQHGRILEYRTPQNGQWLLFDLSLSAHEKDFTSPPHRG